MIKLTLSLLFLFLVPEISFSQESAVREIATRPGVKVKFLYEKAVNPIATAILFAGGSGAIRIYPNGSTNAESFLLRAKGAFLLSGVSVLIPDAPSDKNNLNDFRSTREHADDNAALIAYLRKEESVPVWAIGTSNGSLSAVATTLNLKSEGPKGIVLASTVTKNPGSGAHSILTVPLENVTVPVLLVHHKDDPCYVSPYDGIKGVPALFKATQKVELITVEGGTSGGGCYPNCYHQFVGIENSVVSAIVEWIRTH